MIPTSTVTKTETFGSMESATPAADVLGFLSESLEMEWVRGDAVASDAGVKSFGHVIGLSLVLSACLWGVIFGLIQLI